MARANSPASRNPPPSSAPAAFGGDEAQLVVMGRIVGAFGIHGWLKVKAFSAEPQALGGFGRWIVRAADGWREMALEDFALHAKGPVGKLAGCDDRAAAERLRGSDVAVLRAELGEARPGEIYRVDLVGLEVVDEAGGRIGRVEGFFETGGSSVMVVQGERARMIPFVDAYVKSVDRAAGRITVDWKADYDA